MTPARFACTLIAVALLGQTPAASAAGFTIPQILGAPFASDMVASRDARAFAWVSD